jgi:hypothetical protein
MAFLDNGNMCYDYEKAMLGKDELPATAFLWEEV